MKHIDKKVQFVLDLKEKLKNTLNNIEMDISLAHTALSRNNIGGTSDAIQEIKDSVQTAEEYIMDIFNNK